MGRRGEFVVIAHVKHGVAVQEIIHPGQEQEGVVFILHRNETQASREGGPGGEKGWGGGVLFQQKRKPCLALIASAS
jgi:hypothetical protein